MELLGFVFIGISREIFNQFKRKGKQMQIVISMKELKEALAGLAKVVTTRKSVPVLATVRVSAEGDKVRVTGTNLSEFLTKTFDDASGVGSFLIDFKELREFIKGSRKNGNVSFDIGDDRVTGQYENGDLTVEHTYMRLQDKDWPTEPVYNSESDKITAEAMEAITLALPIASRDDSRRTLNGVLLEPEAVVATDGKQLVRFRSATGVKQNVILPNTKVLSSGLLSGQDGIISQSKCYCKIATGTWEYSVKSIAGTYPQYQHVIPKDSECSLAINAQNADYLKSALPPLECKSEHEVVHLYASGKDVRFLSENLDHQHVKFEAEYVGQEDTVIQMSRKPLLKALELGFNKLSFNPGGVNPILMTGRGDDVFVFMSLYGSVTSEDVIDAVRREHPDSIKPVNTENPKQEEQDMQNKKRQRTGNEAGLKVVNHEETDPFEELFNGIAQLKQQSRDMMSLANDLQQKTKAAQKSVKQQERDFKSTRDILEKLKSVSGF